MSNLTLTELDCTKLIRVYERFCTDDQINDDDPRREAIAWEVFKVGVAPTVDAALDVIEWWGQPEAWARQFVSGVRASVRRLKLDAKQEG